MAASDSCPIAGMADEARRFYGLQFHPEVVHTPQGIEILRNFTRLCGCRADWTAGSFIEETVAAIRAQVGGGKVICALSGGVDSSVVAALVGHAVGDQLLERLARRMESVLREGDTLARLGGDEFVALLIDLDLGTDLEKVLQRLIVGVAEPAMVDNRELHVSASIGVTFYPQAHKVGSEQLLQQADQAMYVAKQRGKNRYHTH